MLHHWPWEVVGEVRIPWEAALPEVGVAAVGVLEMAVLVGLLELRLH